MKLFFVTSSKLFVKEIKGLENLPKGGYIAAANHASFLDPPLVSSAIADKFNRKVHNLGKTELFKSFIGRKIQEIGGTIPIDRRGRGNTALEEAIEYLKNGKIIGIFPEGGRTKDGKLQRAKTGVARLALAARVPVVPVGIKGTYKLWPIKKKLPIIKKIVKINYGKPIYFDKYYGKQSKAIFRKVTTKVMIEIAKLLNQKYKP